MKTIEVKIGKRVHLIFLEHVTHVVYREKFIAKDFGRYFIVPASIQIYPCYPEIYGDAAEKIYQMIRCYTRNKIYWTIKSLFGGWGEVDAGENSNEPKEVLPDSPSGGLIG